MPLLNTTRAPRGLYLLLAAICAGLLGFGLVLEHLYGLEPCPLCISQRIAFLIIGVVSLYAGWRCPEGWRRRICALTVLAVSVSGAALASRQLWLQNLPPELKPQSCSVGGISSMLEYLSTMEILQAFLSGDAQCAEVAWTFIGLSIPGWALLAFLFASGCIALEARNIFRAYRA